MPKLVLTDIDGVWTDGGMYYSENGDEWKKFHVADGAGVLLLRAVGVSIGILTGESMELVRRRAAKLRIEHVRLGVADKLREAEIMCADLGLTLRQVAYIGDDLNDMELLKSAGWSATPANAVEYVRQNAAWRMTLKGGEGVFREFAERLLREAGLLEVALAGWNRSRP
jgi:3-deoxy-D-manno-octulosonate 8-phosphate phosphatase (KDO 8-P phosphatase)